ncbi:hypothetical protein N7468_004923 [Penicillium chermesinum]|uniref:Peptidase M43 pregnancy-associated plasma-A domain-containing protein n=1 Tax=Penicillium chermesinum TaxID=63820 RepID=A0A9W9TMP8_9EURO|nr:uncharacterized protein N7468_004923 [Penicillium chermesinum]KAJ5231967.1 hypothetical protein N7468_004923 [Penicillium chermesinum]
MVCHSFKLFVVLITALFSLPVQSSPVIFQKRGVCATEEPNPSLLRALQQVIIDETNPDPNVPEAREGPIEIDTWFHIISSRSEANQVTDAMINAQFSILQDAYRDASIQYRLHGVTRHVNDHWAQNGDDLAMKQALRKGSYRTLNVFFQTDLQATAGQAGRSQHRANTISDDMSSSILGFCTLPDPSINATSPREDYIGHWNGLLHTFQGESCSADNPGDYIADTPQQSTPTDGCPSRKDSCPDSPGLDAVHDFMDYSSDVCYEMFTNGQMQRMRNMWSTMRVGK